MKRHPAVRPEHAPVGRSARPGHLNRRHADPSGHTARKVGTSVSRLHALHRRRPPVPVADPPARAGATPFYAHHLKQNRPLPQLDLVRDPERMRRVWESLLPQHRIQDCPVTLVRYNPAKHQSCLVCYRLTVGRREGSAWQILSARFYPPGDSLSHYLEAQQALLAAPAFGQPLYHLPELEGVVWAFPNDPKLPGIPALLDRQRLATDVVPRLVRAAGAEAAAGEVSLELVRYNPERGCTARATAPLAGGSSLVCYGKAYSGPQGEATYRHMGALWQAPQRPAWLGIAQPLAYEPEPRILWQLAVEGATLGVLQKAPGPRLISLLEAAGGAAAALHSIPVPGLKRETLADVCARLQKSAGGLVAHAQPRLARRVSALTARLLAEAGRLDTRPAATLHGGLHAGNVVFTGSGVALIDLDGLHAGDPLEDLGSFLASTCGRGLKHEASASGIAEMARAVLRGYERSASWEVPGRDLRWYAAVALLAEQADRRMKRMKSPSLEALLDAAESALSGSGPWESVL